MKKAIIAIAIAMLCAIPTRAVFSQDTGKLTDLARQAYVFGYPLLLMDATMQEMTAPATPDGEGVVNRFFHVRAFPDYTFTDVVSPNADTLYSMAWLDLTNTPVVLDLPDTGGRYYVMQFLDAWTNDFASLGSRTTGNAAGSFLIAGPGWDGDIPRGMTLVEAPTNMVWILGRTQTNGKDDYAAVHVIQDKYIARPLMKVPASPTRPALDGVSPLEKVESMDAASFFAELNRLMAGNPPAPADSALLDALTVLSVGPGREFVLMEMPASSVASIEKGHAAGLAAIKGVAGEKIGKRMNGWSILPDNTGNYGTNYLLRAFIARFGLGANLPEDAVYPTIQTDSNGEQLNGKNRYVIRFAPGQLPPVNAFWSISMYDERQRFIDNPINRYAIGDRDPLKRDEDGGLTIFVQHDRPDAARLANWLPAPAGDFNLIIRLYWPKPSILDGSWPMPSLEKR
jgi:Uncharacterized conserved protein